MKNEKNNQRDKFSWLEAELNETYDEMFEADKKKTIVIRGDQNVPYKSVMKVIDIANKNKLKMILAVKGK